MEKLQKGQFDISYVGNNFDKYFGKIEVKPKRIELKFNVLDRNMPDKEIIKEFAIEQLTLNELSYVLKNNLLDKKGWFICYIEDAAGVLWAVSCLWFDDGWHVYAHSVGGSGDWSAGCQVFSRNSSKTLSDFNPLKLEIKYNGQSYKLTKL
jgi:hypothetical protein